MPGVSRAGIDQAGGTISGVLVPNVLVNGAPIAVKGAKVDPHGLHVAQVMVGSSATVMAGGIPVCRAGDASSCGHTASGAVNVMAN
ncbi:MULTISPECIES: PAAR domain-containing protein [Pseudomonas]|uniref:PAAR domain-containing protein n=1 Tax=Pseudomonas TaxID=286 RepID=UPI003A88E8E5